MLKYILQWGIPYWFNRRVEFDLYWRFKTTRKELAFSIWKYERIDIEQYEHEWGSNWCKHFVLWKINMK